MDAYGSAIVWESQSGAPREAVDEILMDNALKTFAELFKAGKATGFERFEMGVTPCDLSPCQHYPEDEPAPPHEIGWWKFYA